MVATESILNYLQVSKVQNPVYQRDHLFYISDETDLPQIWKYDEEANHSSQWLETNDRIQFFKKVPRSESFILGMDVEGNERQQLYYVDEHKEIERLTKQDDALYVFGGSSPDGKAIAYASNERNAYYYDLYTMDLQSKVATRVYEGDGTYRVLGWHPSNEKLVVQEVFTNLYNNVGLLDLHTGEVDWWFEDKAISSYDTPIFSQTGEDLYLLTNHQHEFITVAKFNLHSKQLTFLIEEDWDIENLVVDEKKEWFAYTVNEGGIDRGKVYHLATGETRSFDLGIGTISGMSWSSDSKTIAFVFNGPTRTSDLYKWSIENGQLERLYCTSVDPNFEKSLVEPEIYTIESFDGLNVPSFLYKPKGLTEDAPLAFWVHGGPEGQTKAEYHPVIQSLTALGYVVCAPNVRGSKGYGKTYIHLDDVRKRMDSVQDLIEIANALKKESFVDESKVAVIGRSYGGFMVLAAITHYPDVFTGAIDLVGISSFRTFLENTGPWRRKLRESEYGTIEEDGVYFDEIDPIHHTEKITAPLLVSHGANDPRVPIGETEQMITELRARNHPVEYIRFEDEGHGIVKIQNQVTAYTAMAEFLEKLYR